MKCVYTAQDAFEANFLMGVLAAEGIEGELRNEFLQEVMTLVPSAYPKIFVEEGEVERAVEILHRHRGRKEKVAETAWRCGCGEVHEDQFAACWRCGAERV